VNLPAKIRKIGKVLIEADKKAVPFIKQTLVRSASDKFVKKYIMGYCSIGYLGCKKNVFKIGISMDRVDDTRYDRILRAWGFTTSELGKALPANRSTLKKLSSGKDVTGDYISQHPLTALIPEINDDPKTHSFSDVGQYLLDLAEYLENTKK